MEYSLQEIGTAMVAILATAAGVGAGAFKYLKSAKGTEDAPSVTKLAEEDRKVQASILEYVENMKDLSHDERERLGALTTSVEILAASVNELIPEVRQIAKDNAIILDRIPRS